MTHVLYRPHIHFGEKIVTTDYLLRSLKIATPDGAILNAPVDAIAFGIAMSVHCVDCVIAPGAFTFRGDDTVYAAPAVAVLDGQLAQLNDPVLAWRNARIALARQAVRTGGSIQIGGAASSSIALSQSSAPEKYGAIFHAAPNPSRLGQRDSVLVTVSNDTAEAEHRLGLATLENETGA